jgi:hypothetical protein
MATVLTPVGPADAATAVTGIAPIVIDLGKEKKRRIKDLKRGQGKLMAEIAAVLNEVRASLGEEADGRQLVPVIVIYKQKKKRKKNGRGIFPFAF